MWNGTCFLILNDIKDPLKKMTWLEIWNQGNVEQVVFVLPISFVAVGNHNADIIELQNQKEGNTDAALRIIKHNCDLFMKKGIVLPKWK